MLIDDIKCFIKGCFCPWPGCQGICLIPNCEYFFGTYLETLLLSSLTGSNYITAELTPRTYKSIFNSAYWRLLWPCFTESTEIYSLQRLDTKRRRIWKLNRTKLAVNKSSSSLTLPVAPDEFYLPHLWLMSTEMTKREAILLCIPRLRLFCDVSERFCGTRFSNLPPVVTRQWSESWALK